MCTPLPDPDCEPDTLVAVSAANLSDQRPNGGNMTTEDPAAEIARLRSENEALKKSARPGTVSFKVSEKGGVSVYGMGRFPVTLYV